MSDSHTTTIGSGRIGVLGATALAVVPLAFLAYFFAYPLVAITIRGLTVDGRIDLGVFSDVLVDPTLRGVAAFTLWQAILSTLATLVLGLPAAWAFARYEFPGKRLMSALTLVPFVLPTLVVGTAFLTLVGPRSVTGVDLTGTIVIIVIAHAFYNVAIIIRGVGGYWSRIDPRIEEAARTLGASPFTAFRTVTLPLLRPAIASTCALVFLFSFTSFGVVLLLGDLSHTTIEVEIWRQATAFLRLDVASTLAVLQLIGVGAILAVYNWLERRSRVQFVHSHVLAPRPKGRRETIAVASAIGSAFVFIAAPLGLLFGRSLSQPSGGWGLENYHNLIDLPAQTAAFIDPSEAIVNSLRFATIAAAIALVVGLLASMAMAYSHPRWSRTFDLFVMLPLGTSAVTIGFGFLIALDWPIDIRTSAALIPIAHALVGVPFVVRTVNPTLGSIRSNLREAAATLGASPFRSWWTIDLRLAGRALLIAAAFAFAISMGEFGATSFITRPSTPTIPIAIFRYLGRPGSTPFGAAVALSVVLMVITALAILIIDGRRSQRDEIREGTP